MDFFGRKVRQFRSIFWKEEEPKRCELTRYEYYFELWYKILSWEDISLTLTAFLVSNFVFWLLVYFQLRIFGAVVLFTLVGFLIDSYFESKGVILTDSSHLEVLEELKADVRDIISFLKTLRSDSPSMFCITMAVLFLIAIFIAQHVSGYLVCYLLLLAAFLISFIISMLPTEDINSARNFIKSVTSDNGVLAEEELIPFISNKDFGQRDADLDSLLTDRTADSVTNSLISGLTSMPSHWDAEDRESLEEEDLFLSRDALLRTPGESDTDSDNKSIRFESHHFNGDGSSSEEEAALAKNLNFADTDDSNTGRLAVANNFMVKIAAAVRDVLDGAGTSTTPAPLRKESSSDSEFEFINSDEMDS